MFAWASAAWRNYFQPVPVDVPKLRYGWYVCVHIHQICIYRERDVYTDYAWLITCCRSCDLTWKPANRVIRRRGIVVCLSLSDWERASEREREREGGTAHSPRCLQTYLSRIGFLRGNGGGLRKAGRSSESIILILIIIVVSVYIYI